MPVKDRRILKSQEAIKAAFIELMSEKGFNEITIQDIADRANVGRRTIYHHYLDKYDLLDKLIEEHINELRQICQSSSELDFTASNLIFFEYFERHLSFFSTMLASSGAPAFRSRLLAFLIEQLADNTDITQGINKGLNKEVLLQFFGAAVVGIMESYIASGLPESPQVIARQVGILLERNL
ncbi:TetR/AcrR family transcriptional regulator [Paenibacillus glycanilyticus]|uniref:TetR/AcrR family transcriptional regulator n=1 Tax=Paenibacillus glycanilyticus TaxID=126569 RepID=UPI002040385A|nr:TetR/AcrR family transcriptional regulator [Paenibacillus glycanilyticus]MCM3630305.1 TetR/AcrR family transcriptional regulator [Paenibacillus glycanilyticus]